MPGACGGVGIEAEELRGGAVQPGDPTAAPATRTASGAEERSAASTAWACRNAPPATWRRPSLRAAREGGEEGADRGRKRPAALLQEDGSAKRSGYERGKKRAPCRSPSTAPPPESPLHGVPERSHPAGRAIGASRRGHQRFQVGSFQIDQRRCGRKRGSSSAAAHSPARPERSSACSRNRRRRGGPPRRAPDDPGCVGG